MPSRKTTLPAGNLGSVNSSRKTPRVFPIFEQGEKVLAVRPYGDVEGLPYARDPENGSLFLAQLPRSSVWASLLTRISQYRNSPNAFHTGIAQSRTDHVYAPKLEWMRDTLRLQGLGQDWVLCT